MPNIPRDRTLILSWGGGGAGGIGGSGNRFTDDVIWNPYNPGTSHQNGSGIFFEPLAFYSAFANKTIPWLAQSWQYTPDFMHLTINLRHGVKWSDGVPFTSADVVYTLQHLMQVGSAVKWGENVQQAVQSVTAPDDYTVKIDFKVSSPLFFYLMTYKYDIGVYIVPKHIFQGKDWAQFPDYDLSKGWPVTTGPWKVVSGTPEQKIIDRRNSWWAVDAGLVKHLPAVQRIVYIPALGTAQMAEAFIANKVDFAGINTSVMQKVFTGNPKVTTFSGQKLPWGYLDWWPRSLFFLDNKPPYNDPNVRWALSYYLDRQQIIQVADQGASMISGLPFPDSSAYPGLAPFQKIAENIEKQMGLNTTEYNPQKGDARMKAAGYTKNSSGMWEKDGKVLSCSIIGFLNNDGPVLAAQLKKHGIDASYSAPTNFNDRLEKQQFQCAIYGHGGSIQDPYFTMKLYQHSSEKIPGEHLANFYQWSNPEWDKLTDQMGSCALTDVPCQEAIWKKAFPIWLKALPDVQYAQNIHNIGRNTTYWIGWPSTQNPYINGAFWHLTFPLTLMHLEPSDKSAPCAVCSSPADPAAAPLPWMTK